MRNWIVCGRASTLRTIIFRTSVREFNLGLGAPTGTGEMVKIIVVNDARSTAYPDELVDVGETAVATGASLVRE